MIVFDLACHNGHVFEIWFGSTADYEDQRGRSLVSCPYCESTKVEKAVMAPMVGAKGNQLAPQTAGAPSPQQARDPAQVKAMLKAMSDAQAQALAKSEFVGMRFAEQARAMHEGDLPHRSIHGQTSIEEAKSLIDDGVPVAPLAFPVRVPDKDN